MKSKSCKKSFKTVVEDSKKDNEQLTNKLYKNGQEVEINISEGESEISADDLDASATDSDEDENDVESNQDVEVKLKSKIEKIREGILQRYEERQGKQLYIRFPHKVPETQQSLEEEVKKLSPLVVKVHKPRQRHARFCLVDFATTEDRNKTLKKLKREMKKGDLKKYVVKIPRTESEEFVNELAERKIKSIENKKAKKRLKKASKKSLENKNFTSTIIVFNLPKTTSLLQLRELFPNAVDIQINPGKGKLNKDKYIGAVTLPTTYDAKKAIKKKLSFGGNQLVIKFDNRKIKGKSRSDRESKVLLNNKSKPVNKKSKLE